MSVEKSLIQRSNNTCELCASTELLSVYEVPPVDGNDSEKSVLLCAVCKPQVEGTVDLEPTHWRCLNDSMWSQTPVVQVMAWRMLKRLSTETWALDLLDMLYLDDTLQSWAEAGLTTEGSDETTIDCNGTALQAGDNVTLVKDLVVKGGNFTAKRGTMVRGISLSDNPLHIEGKVNGQRIVIISDYTKKA